jgi:diguanylate cyclase (GGDEF)-like protein
MERLGDSLPPDGKLLAPRTEQSGRRILVVDADPQVRRIIVHRVRSLGYAADVAGSVEHARALAKAHSYDVVMTDLLLPGANGTQLVAELSKASPTTGFIVMTGIPDLSPYGTDAVNERITGVLSKPFDKQSLVECITRTFEFVETRRRLGEAAANRPISVLLVEDREEDALLATRALQRLGGFEVVQVRRLADAIESVHNRAFDTIITDLSLPDARGLDAVVRLRRAAPEAALIVCSGAADEALTLRIIELGAQDFVLKGRYESETIGRAIRLARVRRKGELQLARLAYTDALTGLWNRSVLTERLDEALAQARRHDGLLGVIYVDLDGFKAINDAHGHDAGDQLLLEVASRLRDSVREYDTVARLGGDEFAVLATHLAPGALISTAERIAAAIALPVAYEHTAFQVTASIGVAAYPEHASDSVLLLKLADEAMYESKHSGKNKVRSPSFLRP